MVAFKKLADGDWEMISPKEESVGDMDAVESYNEKQVDWILNRAREFRVEGYNSLAALMKAVDLYKTINNCELTEDEQRTICQKYWKE